MSFEAIGKAIGRDEMFVASIFYGQAKPTAEDIKVRALRTTNWRFIQLTIPAQGLSSVLGVASTTIEDQMGELWWPDRGLGGPVPVDPVIYRLYEGILVYGHPIKALIHEKFGDGIMSMIDCNITVKRKHHEKGDRVVLTYE